MRVQKKPFRSFLPCTAHISPRECGVWSSFSDPSLPEGATWVTACSHCLHTLGVFTIVFKWLLVSLQSPGPLLAGAQFRSKYCLWKCPVLGCLELVPTQAKGNVTASFLDQGTELSPFLSGTPPLSVVAAHKRCSSGQSMTSALSRGSGSNTTLLLGGPQNVKNTAVPKPKPSAGAVEDAALIS